MLEQKELILLNISGEDKPGLTASLTEILSHHDVHILDIGQSVIHKDLGLGILFQVPKKSGSTGILKDLLFKAYELKSHIKFTPVPIEEYEKWVAEQGKERFIITLLAHKLTALHLSKVSSLIAGKIIRQEILKRE